MNSNYSSFLDQVDKPGKKCSVRSIPVGDSGIIRYESFEKLDREHFMSLTAEEKKKVLVWIRFNIHPSSSVLKGITSRWLKEITAKRTGVDITDNQFREAMMLCDFYPEKVDEDDWYFRIKKSSPILNRQVDDEYGLPMLGERMEYGKKE